MKELIKNNKNKIVIFFMIIILALCCIPPKDYNCKNKLEIITPYGDNEAYHPKVLSFQEPWNGYKYWMSYTPYPKNKHGTEGNDSKENPCIAVSNDLIHWKSPTEGNEPLSVPYKNIAMKIYNSDSHIVYNNDLNRMECYWRLVDDIQNQAILYRRCTTDGKNWTPKEIAAISYDRQKLDYVSPAILYENHQYKMWFINKNNTLTYEESENGLEWGNSKIVPLQYENNKVKTWHLDIIKTEKGYEMLTVAYDKWKNHNNMNLYYSYSQKETEGWAPAKIILKPTTKSNYWDNRGIYRSSFIYENGVYFVFYSGTSKDLHHGVGMVYGKNIEELEAVDTNFRSKKQINKLINKINKERNV